MYNFEITKAALERSTKAVTLRPAKGQYTHKNTAVIEEGTLCRANEKNYEFVTDVPPSIGGGGEGPTPGSLVRSALTSCIAIGVKLWAARAGLQIDYVEVSLEADADARGELGVDDDVSPGFVDLRVAISVESNAPRTEIERAIQKSLRYSPLVDVYANTQKIETTLDIKQPNDVPQKGDVIHA